MNVFAVQRRHLATAFWRTLADSTKEIPSLAFDHSSDSRVMDPDDAERLHKLVHHFAPRTIFELGTGRSTDAINAAAPNAQIWTCDRSRQTSTWGNVQAFGAESHAALAQLQASGVVIEMFVFDGRLSAKDRELIALLAHEHAVMVFDDFEGIEKGVHNAHLLLDRTSWMLMTPEPGSKLAVALKTITWKPQ